MEKKIIIIPPCMTYGDTQSIIGMTYFLLKFYDKVCIYIETTTNNNVSNYYLHFFKKCSYFNKRIFILNNEIFTILDNCEYGEYHICNTLTGDWKTPNFLFFDKKKIDKNYYFNDMKPLYNVLPIEDEYLYKPNSHLPNTNQEINHLFYYKLVGLNNKVRMNYFNYERDHSLEILYKNELLKKYNINEGEKYNIINSCGKTYDTDILAKYAGNNYPYIDIHNSCVFPGYLLLLIEGAASIHLVEGSNSNFIYHCQYKEIINIQVKIYLHIWLNDRIMPEYNLTNFWKMMTTPLLDNWILVHQS
jgi:hypothetical protein